MSSNRSDRTKQAWYTHAIHHWQPGAIVCAPENLGLLKAPPGDQHYDTIITELVHPQNRTTDLGVVISKRRKFVILATHDEHVVALPIKTYASKGVRHFSDDYRKNQHCAIRDIEDKNIPSYVVNGSKHEIMFVQGNALRPEKDDIPVWGRFARMSQNAYVQLNYPMCISVKYDVRFFGKLQAEDIVRLRELFIAYVFDRDGGAPGETSPQGFPLLGAKPPPATNPNNTPTPNPPGTRNTPDPNAPQTMTTRNSDGKGNRGGSSVIAKMVQVRFDRDATDKKFFVDDSEDDSKMEHGDITFQDAEHSEFVESELDGSKYDDTLFDDSQAQTRGCIYHRQLHRVLGARVTKRFGKRLHGVR